MTDAQAAAEAIRRWGPRAWARYVRHLQPGGVVWSGYFVGDAPCAAFCWLGCGETFEQAFDNAYERLESYREPVPPPPDHGPLFGSPQLTARQVRVSHGIGAAERAFKVPKKRKDLTR